MQILLCTLKVYLAYMLKFMYFGHMRKEDKNLKKCIITGMIEGTRGSGKPWRA